MRRSRAGNIGHPSEHRDEDELEADDVREDGTEIAMNSADVTPTRAHPLFNGLFDKERPLKWIRVWRFQPRSGRWVCTPTPDFSWQDLPDRASLFAKFGGGQYSLWALDAKWQKIRESQITLEGPPRNLGPEGATETPSPEAYGLASPPPLPSMSAAGGGGDQGLLMLMLQQQREEARAREQMLRDDARARAEQQQQFSQMMMAMFGNLMQRNPMSDVMPLLQSVIARGLEPPVPPPAMSPEVVRTVADLATKAATAAAGAGAPTATKQVEELIALFLSGLSVAKEMAPSGAAAVPPGAVPPGAQVAQAPRADTLPPMAPSRDPLT